MFLKTDEYPKETSVFLINNEGDLIFDRCFDETRSYSQYSCIPYDDCYIFIIQDANGDGICYDFGNGYYEIIYDGDFVQDGGEFGDEENAIFGGSC